MHLQPTQWELGAAAALMIGISKTGVPGVGILVVTLLAQAFGPRPSIGIMLPMLIFGDIFAVAWYRRHAQWDKLIGLLPWVVAGLVLGAVTLRITGENKKDVLGPIIGGLVLVMLALHLVRNKLGDKLTPKSRVGVASTGTAAGFATTVSNAAGPIMSVFLAAQNLPKEQFMGTIAWYFLIINVSKVPVYAVITAMNPDKPILTAFSFLFTLVMSPVILIGVFIGKWMLPRFSQTAFDGTVLVLAAASAIHLIYKSVAALLH